MIEIESFWLGSNIQATNACQPQKLAPLPFGMVIGGIGHGPSHNGQSIALIFSKQIMLRYSEHIRALKPHRIATATVVLGFLVGFLVTATSVGQAQLASPFCSCSIHADNRAHCGLRHRARGPTDLAGRKWSL
jgi:hypothetical protein